MLTKAFRQRAALTGSETTLLAKAPMLEVSKMRSTTSRTNLADRLSVSGRTIHVWTVTVSFVFGSVCLTFSR
jgi:hypothetical protein